MPAADRLVLFGAEHLWVLTVFVIGCGAVLLLGGRLRARSAVLRRALRISGAVILLACAPLEAVDVVIGLPHPRTGLPLQICDVAWLLAGIALLTLNRRLLALLYFWGLTLSVQGVVTPDLDHVFPQLLFFGFWLRHIVPVWAAVLLIGVRIGPTWKGFRFSALVTAAWAVVVIGINTAIDSNYGYLNGKPTVHSALDLLGPWPWYVAIEVALVIAVWGLMTWPWNRSGADAAT